MIYSNEENITGNTEAFRRKVGDLMNRVERQALAAGESRVG